MKFEINKTYYGRSICDSDSICKITITKRTDKSIWFYFTNDYVNMKKIIRKKIEIFEGIETVYPNGKYSMAMIINSKNEWIEKENSGRIIYFENYNKKEK